MFTGLHSEMRQTVQEFVRFSKPRFRIPNLGMAYAKHRTSNVSPRRIGHPLSYADNLAKGKG